MTPGGHLSACVLEPQLPYGDSDRSRAGRVRGGIRKKGSVSQHTEPSMCWAHESGGHGCTQPYVSMEGRSREGSKGPSGPILGTVQAEYGGTRTDCATATQLPGACIHGASRSLLGTSLQSSTPEAGPWARDAGRRGSCQNVMGTSSPNTQPALRL